jgi:hypothetical protein
MNPPLAPASPEDLEHLRLLAIAHMVGAVILALVSCLPMIHLLIGFGIMVQGEFLIGLFFAAVAGFLIVAGWTLAVCTFISGQRLQQRRSRTFSIVIAALLCTLMPLGTALGIFTLIVLNRRSVIELYAATATPPSAPPSAPPALAEPVA